jgi:hypothetical protein
MSTLDRRWRWASVRAVSHRPGSVRASGCDAAVPDRPAILPAERLLAALVLILPLPYPTLAEKILDARNQQPGAIRGQ